MLLIFAAYMLSFVTPVTAGVCYECGLKHVLALNAQVRIHTSLILFWDHHESMSGMRR